MGYFEIILLLGTYLLLIMVSTVFSKKVLLTPEFVFLCGFIPQFTLSLFYVERWDLRLSIDTFLVYVIGASSFFFFSVAFHYLLCRVKTNGQRSMKPTKKISLNKWKLIVAIVVQLVAILVMSRVLMTVTNRETIQAAINIYTINSKGQGMKIPSLPGKLNLFSYVSGYVWIYYIVHGIVYRYKTSYALLVINLLLSTISNLLTGSRGGVVQTLLVGLVLYYIFWSEKKRWKSKLKAKHVFNVAIICILILVVFKYSLDLLGRSTSTTKLTDYLAHYLSAEVKNLDMIICGGGMGVRDFFDWETLNRFISGTFGRLGFDVVRQYADESTYMVYGGISMGNVYTIYSSFIKDLHYFGLLFFGALMAFISQLSFKYAIFKKSRYNLELGKLVYAYILVKLFFAFFSNWFFNDIISTGFLWCVLFWNLIRMFAEGSRRMKFRRVSEFRNVEQQNCNFNSNI